MTWSNLSKGSRCSALCWKLGGKHPDMQLIACCQWILLKLPMFFSSNGFKLFSERRFTYQGITKFCTESYVINSIHRYHWVSSFSIALITCIQQLNFFLHSPSLLWRYKRREGGRERGRERFCFFYSVFFDNVYMKERGSHNSSDNMWCCSKASLGSFNRWNVTVDIAS